MGEEIRQVLSAIDALDKKFSSSISKLQQEVTAGQEATSQEVVKRINKRSYQFQKKGNEAQFMFNATVEEHIESAKRELTKVLPSSGGDQKLAITKVVAELEEGTKAIAVRQKHIRIADRSELGWGVVAAYENDELAEDSDDEKRLFKAEKEAERKQQKKRRKLNPSLGPRRRGPEVPAGRGGGQGNRSPPIRPRLVGPCFRCGEFGHLVAGCTKPRPAYPFVQPLVSEVVDTVAHAVTIGDDSMESVKGFIVTDQNNVKGVKTLKELCELFIHQSVNSIGACGTGDRELLGICGTKGMLTSGDMFDALAVDQLVDLGRYWEVDRSEPKLQVTDVQGRLRQAQLFWRDTL